MSVESEKIQDMIADRIDPTCAPSDVQPVVRQPVFIDLFDRPGTKFPAYTWGPMPADLAPTVLDGIKQECSEAGIPGGAYHFEITEDSNGCAPQSCWVDYL